MGHERSQTSYPNAILLGEIAQAAGRLTLEYFRKNLRISEKGNNQGIVTDADVASENLIKQLISEHFPHHAILAEESGLQGDAGVPEAQPLWIIDPIDGTTNFSKGNPYYCVSIAFAERTPKGCEVLAGAIFQPATGDLYTADKGKGSFCNGEPMRVSSLGTLAGASLATGFSSNKGTELRKVIEAIEAFQNDCLGLRVNGAAALDMAWTARGILQGFYEKSLSPWDMAAGALLVAEAGGVVVNFDGQPFDTLRDRDVLCGNETLVPQMLRVIRECWPSLMNLS